MGMVMGMACRSPLRPLGMPAYDLLDTNDFPDQTYRKASCLQAALRRVPRRGMRSCVRSGRRAPALHPGKHPAANPPVYRRKRPRRGSIRPPGSRPRLPGSKGVDDRRPFGTIEKTQGSGYSLLTHRRGVRAARNETPATSSPACARPLTASLRAPI